MSVREIRGRHSSFKDRSRIVHPGYKAHAPSPHPARTCSARPSPSRGGSNNAVLAARPRPSFAPRKTKSSGRDPVGWRPAVGPASSRSRLVHKKSGRRNADRRVDLPSASTDAAARPDLSSLCRVRRGQGRGALACRRSTAALAAANQRRRSAPARASWDVACSRRYLKRACRSPASFSQTGHGAGRAFSRSRPGTTVTSRRPREPHSPRPPASPGGRPVS